MKHEEVLKILSRKSEVFKRQRKMDKTRD